MSDETMAVERESDAKHLWDRWAWDARLNAWVRVEAQNRELRAPHDPS